MTRGRAMLLRILAVGLVLVAALLLAELVLRISGLAAPGGIATVSQRDFERIPGVYAPGQHVLSRDNPALPHTVSINSLGYRGDELPETRPSGEFRVFFTGDSFTYGSFVDDSVTVPALVEGALRPSCPNVRVINAGLGGSTITDQAILVSRGMSLAPDLVIVMFSENDVTDLHQVPMWDRLAANRHRKSRFPASMFYATARRTALWNVLLRAKARVDAARMAGAVVDSSTDHALHLTRRSDYTKSLAALRDTLRAHSLPLVFAAMPTHLTLSGTKPDEQIRWALALADSLELPRADILSAMRATGKGSADLYSLPHDGHTSGAGNHIAAGAIANVVRSLPPLLGTCTRP